MSDLKKLRADYEKAEEKAQKIMAFKDNALAKVRKDYTVRLQKANADAAAAQKTLNDAEAAAALVGRDDAEAIAGNLGLELPG